MWASISSITCIKGINRYYSNLLQRLLLKNSNTPGNLPCSVITLELNTKSRSLCSAQSSLGRCAFFDLGLSDSADKTVAAYRNCYCEESFYLLWVSNTEAHNWLLGLKSPVHEYVRGNLYWLCYYRPCTSLAL